MASQARSNPISPVREVWSIAWPTVMTMASYTVMQFVDGLMVARVGPLELAAQGNAGIWTFTPIAFAMGLLTVVNTYVAQHFGAGRPKEGPKYAWAAVWMSLAIWVVFLLPFALVLPSWFALTHDEGTIAGYERLLELEITYGRILLGGAAITMIGRGMHHYFFGLHRPKIITVAAITGNIANVVINYILIFGAFGLPALGLTGAAIGTVCGSAIELVIPLAVFLGPKMHAELGTRNAWRPRWAPVRDILRIGWPASVQFGNEILCWSIFMTVLVGRFGEDHMTAGWATLRYLHLSFMPAVGFSVAATSLVGRYIGAGDPDTAVKRARLGLALSVVYMTACALVFYFFRVELIEFFVETRDIDPARAQTIIAIGAKLMICAAVFQTVDAFGIVYSGALRGAGDTIWPGTVTMLYAWAFIVGGGWLISEWKPEWESVGPWIGAAIYIIMLGVTMAYRFESGAWRGIRLMEQDSPSAETTTAATAAPISPGPPAPESGAAIRASAAAEGFKET